MIVDIPPKKSSIMIGSVSDQNENCETSEDCRGFFVFVGISCDENGLCKCRQQEACQQGKSKHMLY